MTPEQVTEFMRLQHESLKAQKKTATNTTWGFGCIIAFLLLCLLAQLPLIVLALGL